MKKTISFSHKHLWVIAIVVVASCFAITSPVLAESESQIVDEASYAFPESLVTATTTIFSDNFSGSHPGSWSIGHDGGGGSYAWAWPNDYAHCYADPYGSMYRYPDNLHVYMERRNVSLSGCSNASLFFNYIVDTEASWDYFSVNVRDQSGNWHEVWRRSGITDPLTWSSRTLNLDSFAGQSNLYIQFRFDSDGSVSGSPYDGVYIDNVTLTAVAAPQDADLALQNLTVSRPSDTTARTFTSCGFDIRNNGPAALSSESILVDYYLSNDTTFGDADDRKIGDTGFTVTIASGSTYHINLSSTGLSYMVDEWTSCLVPNGSYYVYAQVRLTSPPPTDPTSSNNYDRTNSTFTYSGCGADLELLNLAVSRPSDTTARTFTACGFDIRNNGPAALSSESILVDYYLSNDTTFGDADDRKIGDTGFTVTIASGSTYHINLSSTGLSYMVDEWTSCLVPNGSYYVYAQVRLTSPPPTDPTSSNNYDRTNSTFTYSGCGADLELLNLTVSRPSDTTARTFTACGFDIRNNGPAALSSESILVEYYLSNDTTFGDSDDRKIGDTGFTVSIASGATYHINLSSTGLSYMVDEWTRCLVTNGNYYVFAKVRITSAPPSDPTSGNNYDRTNSTFSYSGCGYADLALLNLTVSRPSSSSARTFTACGFDIRNNGPEALSSESILVDYYLSNDTTFGDADDRKIGDTGFTVSIASGATYHINLSSIGLGYMVDEWTSCLVPNGSYYVFAEVRLTSPPPTDPTSSNNYDRTNSTFSYSGCGYADIRIEPLTLDFESSATSATSHKDPNTIELRNRSFLPPSRIETSITTALMSPTTADISQHFLIQFAEDVNDSQLKNIEELGLKLVQYGSNRVLSVSGYSEQITKAFERGIIRWAGRLEPEDKMPRMSLLFGRKKELIEKPLLVTFHPDVSILRALKVLKDYSLVSITNEFLGQSYLITYGTSQDILVLAGTDEVSWIQLCSQDSADAVENGEPVYFCPGGIGPYGIRPMWATRGEGWDGPGLGTAALTYHFLNHTSDISVVAQETACTDAMAVWSQFSSIIWTGTASADLNRSVDIGWFTGDHGDGYPFDGPGDANGNTLAHAFYPSPPVSETNAGDMHFDDFETWEIGNPGPGFDLFSIALHELGHSLGLEHSSDPDAVMRPVFSQNTVFATLHADDIAGIQSLYASPEQQDFIIYNDGAATLTVTNITKQSASCWLTVSPSDAFDVAPGGSQAVTVSVDATCVGPGIHSDRLLVYSNDPDPDKSPYPNGVFVTLTITCVSTTIVQPPQDITICEGQDAVFDIDATGSEPLHYQWKKDGNDVGIDSSMLTLYDMQLADDGSEIWCEVTNGCGSVVVSTSAFLTVYPWPTVTINPNPDQLNAAWILDGPNGYTYSNNGDETIADLEFGSYTITWSTIPRWNTPLPNPDTKSLSVGNSINFIGNYQLIGDLNNDYSVDYEDLARLANEWLWTGQLGGIPEDIMQDGIVNFADFALLAQNWMVGVE